jgi:hypothetical protein
MRWTEIEGYAREQDLILPTYRQMDIWTRTGLLKAEKRGYRAAGHKGDRAGVYRWWSDTERDVALLVARLAACGVGVDLAFQVARTQPDKAGVRTLILDGAIRPHITITVNGR